MKDGPSYACDKKFGMGILCIAINYFQRQNSIPTEDAEHSSKFTSRHGGSTLVGLAKRRL